MTSRKKKIIECDDPEEKVVEFSMADVIQKIIAKEVEIQIGKSTEKDVIILKEYIDEVISKEIKKHLIGVFEELLVKLKGE